MSKWLDFYALNWYAKGLKKLRNSAKIRKIIDMRAVYGRIFHFFAYLILLAHLIVNKRN